MMIMTIKSQGHSLIYDQGHSDSTFSNFFSSKQARLFEAEFHMQPPWDVEMNICYERDFMTSLSDVKQAEIIKAFKSTSRYLDDLLNNENPYFEGMVNRIYPPELQLNKTNTSDTEAPFLDLHLSVSNGFVSSKIYDKRDDFDNDVVNFPFLDSDVPRSTSYGVYFSQLIRFARVSSHVVDFNACNKILTAKLVQQGYRYHKLRKTFSKFIDDTMNWFLNPVLD